MFEQNDQYLIFPYNESEPSSPQFLLFQELLENGLADREDDKILISHQEICRLSSVDQKILTLPESYPFDIKIDSDGLFQNPDFRLKLRFFEYNHGSQIVGKRSGCIFTLTDSTQYLLSPDQYLLCEAVDEFNALPDKELSSNLIKFSEIKALSRKSAAVLDSFLEKEQILVPEKVCLKLRKGENESLEILPEIENLKEPELVKQFEEKKFDRFNEIQKSYTLTDDKGNRIRIPLSKVQQDEFRKIKRYRKNEGELKEKLIENPQQFFDPDVIDLDNFSERVIDIGFYKPQYFPFVSPYKSEWIPGIIVDKGNEKTKVSIRDSHELAELEAAYKDAVKNEESKVKFKGAEIPPGECNELIALSKKQFEHPEQPVRKTENGKKVLIIEDNLHEDKYHENKNQPIPVPEIFIHNFKQPPNLKSGIKLYEHQKEGIAWMESLLDDGYPGSLLADDMGLGKTLQILSFIDWHNTNKNPEKKPYLIVAPVSLLENWNSEYFRFFKSSLTFQYVYGFQISLDKLRDRNIFITNYETVRNHQLIFGQVDWAVVVTDEAQRIKTPGTLITNAIKALKADFKIAATGTPVENSMVDLWCIVDFIVPGLLGSAKDFAKNYQRPIRKDISDEELNQLGTRLRSEIGLYFKRRLKENVLSDLPEKIERRTEVLMPEDQKNLYIQEIRNSQGADKQQILSVILNLKKISDHPYLTEYNYREIPSEKLIRISAKLKATVEILEEIKRKNEKAIIFAEFKETQRILQKIIQEHFKLKNISILNGDTATRKGKRSQKETRQEAIDRFSDSKIGFNVIIMSQLAAGVGLNVTAANHVIHYSRHWNPAKEAQATDRAHRIGQRKTVYVYYPMAVLPDIKTFDVILDKLLLRKRNLADSAMFPSAMSDVRIEDVSEKLSFNPKDRVKEEALQLEELDQFEPYFFEAAIAAIFKKRGFKITLTPKSNDKGADIVARSEDRNLLIQVKQSGTTVNDKAVGEVLKAKGYYEWKYKEIFSLLVATNNELNSNALLIAENNQVQKFDRSDLQKFFSTNQLFFSEIREIENERCMQI
jgi:SNF2 family DNA or RNA helicase